jgi:hypothetical protein
MQLNPELNFYLDNGLIIFENKIDFIIYFSYIFFNILFISTNYYTIIKNN